MPPYVGPGEQDVLDVTDDAIARFGADPDRVVLSGYSLGGVGTYRLAQLHPDRWAGAVAIVGAHDLGPLTIAEERVEGVQTLPNQLENLRNLPFRFANARGDELIAAVGLVHPELAALELHQLGYDYRYHQLLRREHLTFPVRAVQCELEAAIARGRVRDPARVTFSQEPAIRSHDPETGLDLGHDRAYWMSEMVVRGDSFSPGDKGTIDITSLARADREPIAEPILGIGQNVTEGADVCGPNADVSTTDVWTTSGQAWTGHREQPASNALVATLTRVSSVTVDLSRMDLRVDQPLQVSTRSDGEGTLGLAGPWSRAVAVVRPGRSTERVCPIGGVLELAIPTGDMTATVRSIRGGAPCR